MEQLSKDRRIIRLEETESTNLYLKQLAREEHLEEGSMVIADFQTVGRGQMGNSWFSSKGENLLFSLLIYPKEVLANEQFIISRIASLAVKNTLDRFADDIRIKWPNDIYWKEQKIAGILIENDIDNKYIANSVIGIGINVNQQIFPPELSNPVSLWQIIGSVQDRDYILDIFQREFFLLYRDFEKGEIKTIEDEYMLDLYRVNGYYWYEDKNGRFMAKVEDVLPSGHLVLKTIDTEEERKYAFKEVTFVE
ncbi:BirA family transcriptional regulator, biotin operon repressor / biotin-[acetyl-CoA-carboxylase] ligase [Porphyromonadaceae bacterium NLAE-zl-C104]|jgi:BirA family biotin operon repressor/biotin-[acetyl-CoA-carboxylase] ligase|uniref:biotin--[acetyl-CoA-carboxylase] ligase n=1 Tax=Proteiniphilum TaxID=294702 RepID=UPI0008953E80|nr:MULTISPECIES: biotin--[acetyl-CoA-carboxylase] ligase [Proteiniphilum]MDY9917398.1 biotin--[acetyl-CoA-carboxylase] ligase [Proteiniphilum sp.]SEA30072.1 BirA family transcriptional regulator, biotin operon repressor / biotin-[acetyl-CoA-carboxylase] ligase [Porphyromonadaceae bacterium KH3R12]SFS79525.1 BirA family transcriptional regulator, biotin operon repressor / biotin-[acetyl-CoA-carboxylase] ligase [Porphyromonadaceae bacterium NLAE-zl-C104]